MLTSYTIAKIGHFAHSTKGNAYYSFVPVKGFFLSIFSQ